MVGIIGDLDAITTATVRTNQKHSQLVSIYGRSRNSIHRLRKLHSKFFFERKSR